MKRTSNVGVCSKELCISYALSGPMIRGSGIPLDLRKDRPYSVYDRLEFDVHPEHRGLLDEILAEPRARMTFASSFIAAAP